MAESTQKNAEESADAMDEAVALMGNIRQHTEKSAEQIMSLGEKSQQIGKVLAIINEVAAETKMLSLNAAIEASKAGEAGKGFTVVASEIRKLAENVVKSTGSIEEIASEIEKAMQEIVAIAEQTTDSARQVSMSTGQQKSASEQVVLTMHELSDVARQMAAAAGETTQSADSLTQMSAALKKIISGFKLAG
ncbi:MAG: hypothetical protein B6240_05840 [Desulfobacteraceae bacterium 4572_87]|nr:MAG: hypothetical protein B6240_05840 [Desulfobacteraceae bacterium 4572_87]